MNKFYFLILSLLGIVLTACGGESDDNGGSQPASVDVTFSQDAINVSAVGQTTTIQVKTNAKEWTAYAADGCSTWVKATPNMQAGTITVVISANDGEARKGSVYFKSGQTRKEITITQEAPLTVTPTSLFFPAEGGTQKVTLSINGSSCSASTSADWIVMAISSGTLVVTALANTGDYRTADITVTVGEETAIVNVKQDGNSDIVCPIEGYHLVWNDEFSEGTELSSKDWTHEVKGSGWVNNELQNYVNHKSPKGDLVTEIKDGHLQIHCFKEDGKIYSGRVYGKKSTGWKYGYVEASINLPSGKGTWPAFWMMPVNFTSWPHDGEIDIMEEVGYHKDYVSSSLHADGHVHSNNTQVTKEVYCKGAEGEFHTYGMEWTPDYFQFYVDGKKTLYYKNPGTGVVDWPYDAPFYVIFNLAWGGSWGGAQGVNESALPVTMEVDYVRVFQK